MSKAAKQVIIILGVLLVLSIVVALSTFSQKANLQETNTQLQTEIAGYKKDLVTLDQKKEALASENDTIKKQANEILGQKDKLEEEVNNLTAKVSDLESRTNEITDERNEWKQKYEKAAKQRDEAVAKVQETEEKLAQEQKVAEGAVISAGDSDKQLESHWAQVLKEKAELNLRITKLEDDLNQSALGIEELKKKNSDLGLEISAFKQEKEELERQIKRRGEVADNISIDLVREKNDKKFISGQLERMKDENLALRAEVKELSAMKIVLEKSISRLQEDKAGIERKLVQSETIVQDRLEDVLKIKEDLSQKTVSDSDQAKAKEIMLPPIIVNGSSGAKEPEQAGVKTAGQIVSINQESNFVIIDLGQTSGINIADTLSVYRGDTYVGEIEVIQVRTDISAADIKKQSMPLQVGDSVR